jgi:polygalacturonase
MIGGILVLNLGTTFAAASAAGGGTVRVPPGTFTTLPFNLTSHTTLKLEWGAVLQAVIENQPGAPIATSWPKIRAIPSYAGGFDFQGSGEEKYHPLIFGYQVRNVSVLGPGKIDGGAVYWLSRVAYDCAASGTPRL